MQCITDKFDSLNIIECAIAQTYLSGTDCPGHWLALEGVGRGLDLNWTLVFQSKFTLLSYCLFSRFKASHWLRVRGKVLQWLFQRTTVQFYLLMSPPKLPWNLSKLVMQILTMAECLRKCQVFLYLPREWSMTPMLFGQWHKCSLTGQAIALGCAQYTSTLELSSAFSAKTQQRAWLPNIQI